MSTEDEAFSYDLVPYTSYPYVRTHPDRLATIGRMFGMDPAPITSCRVLELGCASGGNLIPMAEQLPRSRMVGIDLGARQIEEGQAAVQALGLDNVDLRHGDILEVDDSWGAFDYIICHGVFSWVPRPVQDKILQLCHERLTPQGIAYISYNTYPGWHLRDAVRHMMRYHTGQFTDPGQRTDQAGALVDFLAGAVDPNGAWGQLLRRELALISRTGSDYVFHEHLEEVNTPLYFHQMVERARDQQLQYLGEADVHTMLARGLSAEVVDTLGRISPDITRHEQYLDFVHNRQFRATLLCHAAVDLDRALGPTTVVGGWLGFAAVDDEVPIDLSPGVRSAFRTPTGLDIGTDLPITKAALQLLRRAWPDLVSFEELVTQANGLVRAGGLDAGTDEEVAQRLGADLLELYCSGGLELHSWRPSLATRAGDRPRVSRYARYQAEHAKFVTTRRHVRLDLDVASAMVVRRLDGEHDREALVDTLVDGVLDGSLSIDADVDALGRDGLREPLGQVLTRTLDQLAAHGLLVG
ncbi:MAG: class I SAM-dependent methyltransferase [Deltaproteobacteria bacterium]|nr:class I SAM-dependent methyltransferase [Deltaproteobacteria bacterium]